ncbi:hypothetical protein Tco_0001656 [Tanacetum coccineum]
MIVLQTWCAINTTTGDSQTTAISISNFPILKKEEYEMGYGDGALLNTLTMMFGGNSEGNSKKRISTGKMVWNTSPCTLRRFLKWRLQKKNLESIRLGSIGTSSEHSVDLESEISRVPSEVYVSSPITTTEKATPKVNRKNWNAMMERELGEGYSFTKKKCFVCGSLSHLIKDCDYYEKKMAREAEFKKQRVFNTGSRVPNLNAGRPNINSVRPNVNNGRVYVNFVKSNVNTGRTNVNHVRPRVNTGSSNVNTVRSRQP